MNLDFGELPKRALVFAASAGEALGCCGGVVGLHVERGDAVRWIVATGAGAGVDALGSVDVRTLAIEAGRLGAQAKLAERLAAELEEFKPSVVYVPDPHGGGDDERALGFAAAAALANTALEAVIVYGAPKQRLHLLRLDISHTRDRKATALRAAGVEALGLEHESFERSLPCKLHVELREAGRFRLQAQPEWRATAVISTWNKLKDVCQNIDALRAQTRPFDDIVVVDNASSDATASTIRERYPEVRLSVMPHSRYGACETFNIGFASVLTPLMAILDDDVVLPPNWLEKTVERIQREPETTAIVSGEVEEPGMPAGYLDQPHLASERYMSTFRGCASLARTDALRKAGFYDERLFIYGNERDLTCRLLNLGYRVLQFPEVRAFHKTPFGIKMGKRSLYYHARNAWLTQLKYAPAADLARLPFLVLSNVLLRGEKRERDGKVADATGTIGIGRSLRETPGAWWVVSKAAFNVLANVPYCLKHRQAVHAPDFELPLK